MWVTLESRDAFTTHCLRKQGSFCAGADTMCCFDRAGCCHLIHAALRMMAASEILARSMLGQSGARVRGTLEHACLHGCIQPVPVIIGPKGRSVQCLVPAKARQESCSFWLSGRPRLHPRLVQELRTRAQVKLAITGCLIQADAGRQL